MSLFDSMEHHSFVTLEEAYPNELPFIIVRAEYEGLRETSFGQRECAKIWVLSEDGGSEPTEFLVWGAPAMQIKAIEDGELPARVFYRKAKPNRIEPAQVPLSPERAAELSAQSVSAEPELIS